MKKLLFITTLIFVLSGAITVWAESPAEMDGPYPIEVNGQWGYIDPIGKTVIAPQFSWAGSFSEGLAVVEIQKKYGYIDRHGKLVIKAQFDNAGGFKEGRALVKLGKKYGFVDKSGQRVIPIKYDEAWDFNEGLAAVALNGRWGFIDSQGQLVIKPQYKWANPFADGVAPVSNGKKYGYINKANQIVIPIQFDGAWSFFEGLAVIKQDEKCGFIDKNGKVIIDPIYEDAYRFSEGLAAVNVGGTKGLFGNIIGGKWGFIDKTGKIVITPKYDGVAIFSAGVAAVNLGGAPNQFGFLTGGKWGFIDRTGKVVINLQFDEAYSFSQGLSEIMIDEKVGYIDPNGRYVWEPMQVAIQVKVDFATPNSGFSETGTWRVQDGELLFQGGTFFNHNYFSQKVFSDSKIKVKAKWLKDVPNNGFGVIFRGTDESNFYAFLITSDGYYKLSKLVANQPQQIVALTKTDLLKADYNELLVDCRGDSLRCLINGVAVIEIKDESIGSGYFYIGLGSNPLIECKFDDFEVITIDK